MRYYDVFLQCNKRHDNIELINIRTMATTIKFLDADLVNGKTMLMVGIKQITISSEDYRMLRSIANDWTSGLSFVSNATNGTLFKFTPENAYGMSGRACNNIVEQIINK